MPTVDTLTLRAIARRVANSGPSTGPASLHTVNATIAAHPELQDAARVGMKWREDVVMVSGPGNPVTASQMMRPLSPAQAGYAWWLFSRIDRAQADEFMQLLISGDGMDWGNPVLSLRVALMDATAHRTRVAPSQALAAVIHAWNQWRDGRTDVKLLVLPRSLPAASFPQPH